jgi:glycosyltransferase involved in cell wall biosynthesis
VNLQSQPLVSIVTPIYNGEEHLAECIESVLAQTYHNWEYIIVNNCSSDNSLAIAQSYGERNQRIRVHNNTEFLRIIPNHNNALRQISGASKYCKMIFADDWLYPDCVERMVALAEANPSVGIVAGYGLRGAEVVYTGLPYTATVMTGREICRLRFFGGPYVFGTPSSHMIRSDLVRGRNPFYNESNIHADAEVCFDLLKECAFGFLHQVVCYSRKRDESMTMVSKDLNTMVAGTLYDLVTHGPFYLTPSELERCLKLHMRRYYNFLGRSVWQKRDKRFWAYHKDKLREVGLQLNRLHLYRWACMNAVKRTIEQMSGGRVRIA